MIININKVESCGSSSKPKCPEYTYKGYEERSDILSNLPSARRLGQLSLAGTHQSMTYSSTDSIIKSQDLSVADQLRHGVRVLDVTVRLQDSLFRLYSRGVDLNSTLFNVLFEIEQFLHFYSREFLMLIINYDYGDTGDIGYDKKDEACKKIDQYRHSVGGWRIVKNWRLTDTLDQHRSRILLATNEIFFDNVLIGLNLGACFQMI